MGATAHKVKFGKKFYTLKYGTKAMRVYEREAEAPITDLTGRNFGIATIVYLLHAGMVYEHPEVTVDDLDEMLDEYVEGGGDVTPIVEKITTALSESGWFTENPTKASASTKDSGESPAE